MHHSAVSRLEVVSRHGVGPKGGACWAVDVLYRGAGERSCESEYRAVLSIWCLRSDIRPVEKLQFGSSTLPLKAQWITYIVE